ncbi:MAG: S26 family signal peptidase [Euryarchaeota archaeon]|nr:S26 family signal peptidase [Euryarchaeota archaeon]
MAPIKKIWNEVRAFVYTLIVFLIIIGAVFLYSGIWPPFVVVESASMQHSDDTSRIGIMDTGDLILVKEHSEGDEVVTYVEGYSTDHRTFGDYGDVIVYQRDGTDRYTPVIHRAIVLLVYNSTSASYDVPSLEGFPSDLWSHDGVQDGRWWALAGDLTIYQVGYEDATIIIPLDDLLSYGRGGFITKGDNNNMIDQNSISPISSGPVQDGWVVSAARGELPWFGLLKLWATGMYAPYGEGVPENSWTNMFVCIALIIVVPFTADLSNTLLKRRGIDVVARISSKMPWHKKKEEGKDKK